MAKRPPFAPLYESFLGSSVWTETNETELRVAIFAIVRARRFDSAATPRGCVDVTMRDLAKGARVRRQNLPAALDRLEGELEFLTREPLRAGRKVVATRLRILNFERWRPGGERSGSAPASGPDLHPLEESERSGSAPAEPGERSGIGSASGCNSGPDRVQIRTAASRSEAPKNTGEGASYETPPRARAPRVLQRDRRVSGAEGTPARSRGPAPAHAREGTPGGISHAPEPCADPPRFDATGDGSTAPPHARSREHGQGALPLPGAETQPPSGAKAPKRRRKSDAPPLPIPFADFVAAVVAGAGPRGEAIAAQWEAEPRRWVRGLSSVIRAVHAAGCGLDEVQRAGEVMAGWKNARGLEFVASQDFVPFVADQKRTAKTSLPPGFRDAGPPPRKATSR